MQSVYVYVQNSAFWLRYILFIGLFKGLIHLGSLTLGVYCNMQTWLISATWGQVLNTALDCLHFSIDLCYFVKIENSELSMEVWTNLMRNFLSINLVHAVCSM